MVIRTERGLQCLPLLEAAGDGQWQITHAAYRVIGDPSVVLTPCVVDDE